MNWNDGGKIRALLFDFDGTLIDTSEAILSSFNGALSALGRKEADQEVVYSMMGRPLQYMFSRTEDIAPDDPLIVELIAAYRRCFFAVSLAHSKPFPGTVEALDFFHGKFELAIVTSRISDGAFHILDGLGLRSYFSTIVGLEHVENSKPHPEPVLTALRALALEPGQAIMIGDTVDDVLAGRRAGAKSVGVTTGPYSRTQLEEAGADAVLDGLSGLVELLGSPLKAGASSGGGGRTTPKESS